jgi:hypothetical protein
VNFTLQDIGGSVLATCIFPVFLLLPGYILARSLDIWQFRTRNLPARIALALVLSISVTPGVTYLIARFLSLQLACAMFVIAALIFLGLVAKNVRLSEIPSLSAALKAIIIVRWPALLVLGWMAVVIILLSDLQVADRLYPNVVSYDYTMRIAVTGSITRTGVPPVNPYFYPSHPMTLHYYYFWFMTCSLVDLLGGSLVQPRTAVIAGTAWVGAGMMAILALYVRLLPTRHRSATPRSIFVALALLLVSGFDIEPVFIKYATHWLQGQVLLYPTVEWWNEQITAWPTAVLWVPHHIAGLIAALTTFLVFSNLHTIHTSGRQAVCLVVCALALFSALGLSIWVTFTFAAFWIAWLFISFMKGWYGEASRAMFIAVLGVILSIPYLIDLHKANLTTITPIIVSVRQFQPVHTLLENDSVGPNLVIIADLIALPLNYLMEFGFFAIAGILYWRWSVRTEKQLCRNEIAFVTLAASALMIATFLRSNIAANDLGWRSAMFVQLILLLWSTTIVQALHSQLSGRGQRFGIQIGRGMAVVILSALSIGMTPILYDVVMMKLYSMAGDLRLPVHRVHGFLDEDDLGHRYYDFREAYDWIDKRFPESAVVQHNPDIFVDLPSGLYGNRQVAAADRIYGTLFGIPAEMYQAVSSAVSPLFTSQTVDNKTVSAICRRFGITALVVKDTDPIWRHPASWVFTETPIFSNRSTRVFGCLSIERHSARLPPQYSH